MLTHQNGTKFCFPYEKGPDSLNKVLFPLNKKVSDLSNAVFLRNWQDFIRIFLLTSHLEGMCVYQKLVGCISQFHFVFILATPCSNPPVIRNANHDGNSITGSYPAAKVLTYRCNSCYGTGRAQITCQASGQWEQSQLAALSCPRML